MDLEIKQEFEKLNKRFDGLEKKVDDQGSSLKRLIEEKADQVGEKIAQMSGELMHEIEKIQNSYVSKAYLDEKLGNFAKANNLMVREDGPDYEIK